MATLTAEQARKRFGATLDRVAVGRERIIVERNGRELAAIVPVEDLRLLERLVGEIEDCALAEVALEREREAATEGAKPVPFMEVRESFGL